MVSKITNQTIYLHNFEENEKTLKEIDGKFITPFQFEQANKIYKDFYDIYCDKKILSLIVAETQMGKTGIMQALTREFVEYGNIEPENILIYGDIKLVNNLSEYLKSATFQISDYGGMNIEYNNHKVLLNRFDKNREQIDFFYNLKEWKLIVGYSPTIMKSNDIINIMFKKCIIVKDKLTFDEINNLDYETIKNSIYIDF